MMKVTVFAVLKDYFEPSFCLDQEYARVSEIKDALVAMNPASASILQTCRFAVNDSFVNEDFKISAHDVISVLPPASGG